VLLLYNLNMKRQKWSIIFIFIFALFLRLSVITYAHHGDLNNNISWGTIAYENGLKNFYEGYRVETKTGVGNPKLPLRENGEVAWPYSAPNQPPLTIEMFSAARFVWQKVRDFLWYMNWTLLIFPSKTVWFWDEKGMDVMVKLPSVIADLGIGILIYLFVKNIAKKSEKTAVLFSIVWLFNPLTWYNSAVWGQTDPIVNFLGLLAIYFLFKKKLPLFGVIFTMSLLFKGSLAIFLPVLFYWIVTQRYSLKVWVETTICSLLTIIFISVWFHPQWNMFFWLINLYKNRILPGEIGYLTANAFNFWWLVNSGKVIDSTVFLGLSARVWGFVLTAAGMLLVIKWVSAKANKTRLFFALAMVSLLTFLFLTRIHERYLYPFFPSATIGLSLVPSFWPIYVALSITFLVNQFNLFWVPAFPALRALLGNLWFTDFLSLVNIAMLFVSFRLLNSRKV
jgi:Gpi18-like mannosyltransferase